MKKRRLRVRDLPDATDGVADLRRKREFQRLLRTSDPAYIARCFKPKKGKAIRFFPTPWRESRIIRAARFVWP